MVPTFRLAARGYLIETVKSYNIGSDWRLQALTQSRARSEVVVVTSKYASAAFLWHILVCFSRHLVDFFDSRRFEAFNSATTSLPVAYTSGTLYDYLGQRLSNFHEPWPPSKFNWWILSISWHFGLCNITAKLHSEGPARGPQRGPGAPFEKACLTLTVWSCEANSLKFMGAPVRINKWGFLTLQDGRFMLNQEVIAAITEF